MAKSIPCAGIRALALHSGVSFHIVKNCSVAHLDTYSMLEPEENSKREGPVLEINEQTAVIVWLG